MKFNLKKIKPPGFLKKMSANRHVRYVIYVLSFAILITVSVYTYTVLSRQYEQKTEFPPVQGTDQVLRRESEPQTVGETKQTQKTASDTEQRVPDSENRTEKEELPENVGGIHSEDPKISEASKLPENTKKPENSKKTDQAKTTQGTDKQPQSNKTETATPAETEPPITSRPVTEPPVTEPPETASPETEALNKDNAPDFTVLDKDGKRIGLSDQFGKPIVINFWATWCPPCKQELPDFDKLYREYGDKVTFMMVNLTDGKRETVDGTKSFVSKNGYSFPVYFDTVYEGADAYNVSSIPQTTFIDKNGNIYTTRIGAMNEATLRSYINAILGG